MHADATPAEPALVLISEEPLNGETPLGDLVGVITPNNLFYARNHFSFPKIDPATWTLTVEGGVERSIQITYDELRSMPTRSLLVTMECAGNGRLYLQPKADGEPWDYGAVSTAEWTGVPLGTVLARAGLAAGANEVLLTGADHGSVPAINQTIRYQRSMPLEKALDPDSILAFAMNGVPLPIEHGFPVRLVTPAWYGMASVKWVSQIEVMPHHFRGFYQDDRYIMAHPERGETATTPLTAMRVRSLITSPAAGASLRRGDHQIRGFAWSGAAPISLVEVSIDGGTTWQLAEFTSAPEQYAWRRWEFSWHAQGVGPATLLSRATDKAGNKQPTEAEWNKLGYSNNAIQTVSLQVV